MYLFCQNWIFIFINNLTHFNFCKQTARKDDTEKNVRLCSSFLRVFLVENVGCRSKLWITECSIDRGQKPHALLAELSSWLMEGDYHPRPCVSTAWRVTWEAQLVGTFFGWPPLFLCLQTLIPHTHTQRNTQILAMFCNGQLNDIICVTYKTKG